ncbi:MAG: DsbE family thiol:disulfide interchange protein [Gammaproteobacteria bacterium]|nr:DsbE family thiol:disulfide interchange protein [Gammaproteobacteria bacterium]MDA8011907.1 DsbE family thiol:disulfide interchange protein [Gammaproteobacteria bacterium]MDA8022838.1 DsbE family thiol:disulfide interchange protein [Gammaproteobacteria bacterium]
MKSRFAAPLLAFAAVIALLAAGLALKPHELPSPFIGKPAPPFTLPRLLAPEETFSVSQMKGNVWMLNVWASWCAACRDEHPLLNRLAQRGMRIVGLNYKDDPEDAADWLRRFGNPYSHIPRDAGGDVGIEYGVYGVPETYLIDGDGVIRFKQVGPLTADALRRKLLPAIEKLRGEKS